MIEIAPIKKLDCNISVPGSKYIANRVLLIAALANGASTIKNVPENDDINAAIEALKKFNVEIARKSEISGIDSIDNKKNSELVIIGTNGKISSANEKIDVKNSGTLLRFITGFASLADGKTKITGSERLQERPINDLLKSLNDLGIKCKSLNKGFPPVEVIGGTLNGGMTKIKGNVSSQFISALLLISPYAKNDVEIIIKSELVSKSYVDMTIGLMKEFGVNVKNENYEKFKIKCNQKYAAKNYIIPADWSSANYFFAAAAIVPGRVKVNDVDLSQKGESEFIEILREMGCEINKGKNSVEVIGRNGLNAVEADMSSMPDSVQTLAAVAVFAKGETKIKNIENLKYKESNRINDTASELKKLGIKVIAKDDELIINGGTPKPAVIDSHNDHRMAMSFALIGLKAGIKIQNPECVAKSFPNFWEKLKEIGAKIRNPKNIVLMGYRGAGKTRTALYLAKRLKRKVLSTDREIEKKVGKIREFIKSHGWEKFREVESEIIKGIDGSNLIIDSGGGFIEREENIKNLRKNGVIMWLKASSKQIRERIKSDNERPSLTGKKSFLDEIEEVLKKREPLYKKAADYEINTESISVEEVGKEILELIKNEI